MKIYGKVKEVSIVLNYTDDVSTNSKQFDSYQDLITFLNEHPEIGKLLDYERDNT